MSLSSWWRYLWRSSFFIEEGSEGDASQPRTRFTNVSSSVPLSLNPLVLTANHSISDHHSISPYTATTEVPLPPPHLGEKRTLTLEYPPLPSSASGSTSRSPISTTAEDIAFHLQGLQDMLTLPGGPLNHLARPSRSQGRGSVRTSVGGESTAPPAYQSVAQ